MRLALAAVAFSAASFIALPASAETRSISSIVLAVKDAKAKEAAKTDALKTDALKTDALKTDAGEASVFDARFTRHLAPGHRSSLGLGRRSFGRFGSYNRGFDQGFRRGVTSRSGVRGITRLRGGSALRGGSFRGGFREGFRAGATTRALPRGRATLRSSSRFGNRFGHRFGRGFGHRSSRFSHRGRIGRRGHR
ncbi:MAG: hypothetical protein AAF297_10125 [Planctomycetota bacterium]